MKCKIEHVCGKWSVVDETGKKWCSFDEKHRAWAVEVARAHGFSIVE